MSLIIGEGAFRRKKSFYLLRFRMPGVRYLLGQSSAKSFHGSWHLRWKCVWVVATVISHNIVCLSVHEQNQKINQKMLCWDSWETRLS